MNHEDYLEQFSKAADAGWFNSPDRSFLAKFNTFFLKFFKKEILEKAEWKDFQEMSFHVHALNSMEIARKNAFGNPNHDIQFYRNSFIYLLYGQDPIEERIRRFASDDKYKIKYLGPSVISELVGWAFVDKYVMFNERDRFAVEFLAIELPFSRGDDFASQFLKFNKAILPVIEAYKTIVRPRTTLPLPIEIDQFFSFLYEQHHRSQLNSAPPISNSSNTHYWTISPGEGGFMWERSQSEGIITIGWNDLGDLSKITSREDMQVALKKTYPKDDSSQKNNSLSCWNFAHGISIGDIVIAKIGMSRLLGYGRVTSEYRYEPNRQDHHHVRSVEWLSVGEWSLGKDDRVAYKTVTDVTNYSDWIKRVMEMMKPSAGNFWWLNANPKIWRFSDLPLGGKQTYTSVNEDGNKRQRYKYFLEVKPGDMIVGYMASPDREVTSLCQITKALHDTKEGPCIEFKKVEEFINPVNYETLKNHPDLKEAEPIINNQGSLFRLTKAQYDSICVLLHEANPPLQTPKKYSDKDALQELYMEPSSFYAMKSALSFKKNIILQGPPGVGKTFVARRLAYAILGEEDKTRVEMIQFHQSYSYEDFIQGYRPTADGAFARKSGIFYDFVRRAQRDKTARSYIMIIDEINRANLGKVFGEIMMLIEADKRGEQFSLPLTYSETADERFWIPHNLHMIGTMNTADRSLALVDFALRRRFLFVTLAPEFGDRFRKALQVQGVPVNMIDRIIQRVTTLNQSIISEKDLGPGFQVGHSFFSTFVKGEDVEAWYHRVIEHEIRPLLHEYWFDSPKKADDEIQKLLL